MLHDPGSYSPPQRFTEISLAPAEREILQRLGGEIAAVAAYYQEIRSAIPAASKTGRRMPTCTTPRTSLAASTAMAGSGHGLSGTSALHWGT